MKFLNPFIDKLQATFPPNRIVVLLTPLLFMPAAGAITAWVTTHFPGFELPEGLVIGLTAAAVLAALQLANKWLDEWQRGEAIDYQADLEQAAAEFAAAMGPDEQRFFGALGTLQGTNDAILGLQGKIEAGSVNEADVVAELGSIGDVLEAFLSEHAEEPEPELVAAAAPAPGDG